ncbi:MAG: 4-hydroxy-3-methylbut-2-enyl diphosphate reductase [Spirochaetales bacterium]|nr:4-hydroxy-3-methylbut-2-enyl diphosphate reductase [Spirochaetales bacterium]
MRIVIPKLSGFCPGVKEAEKTVMDYRKRFPDTPIYVLGYMINNRKYIEYLKERNIITVDSPDSLCPGCIVAIRTHGIDRFVEEDLRNRFEVIDLTCSKVKKVQNAINAYSRDNYDIVINGKKPHPEMKGLISYARHAHIIENREDLNRFMRESDVRIKIFSSRNILIISQTTGDRTLFEEIVDNVKKRLDSQVNVQVIDSICPVTESKEREALLLQRTCDISFVLGDRLSSNANKLFSILKGAKEDVYFIEGIDDIEKQAIGLYEYENAMIVSSASTPAFVEQAVAGYLERKGKP